MEPFGRRPCAPFRLGLFDICVVPGPGIWAFALQPRRTRICRRDLIFRTIQLFTAGMFYYDYGALADRALCVLVLR